MEKNWGLSLVDALSKCVTISKRDAEQFPNEKTNILSTVNICCLAAVYQEFDHVVCFNYLLSVESNQKRLRSEIAFMHKIWSMYNCTNFCVYKRVSLGDRMRFKTLSEKYGIDTQQEYCKIFFVFPDITSKISLKHLSNDSIYALKGYNNFKMEYQGPQYIGLLPSGKKYGGYVKALVHIFSIYFPDLPFFIPHHGSQFDSVINICRTIYNSTVISQEKRLEVFDNLDIQETDCLLWTQNFDRNFPKYAYIHNLFGQLA